MKLHEYDEAIKACIQCVDEETGEIFNPEILEELQMGRNEKIESLCCWVKDLVAEAKAIREEEKILAERRKVLENRSDSITTFLKLYLQGEKFETAKVKCSYRTASSVDIFDEKACIEWLVDNYKFDAYKVETTPVKAEIKKILADEEVPGAIVVTKQSLIIK